MSLLNPSTWWRAFENRSNSAEDGWKTAAIWYGLNRISGNVGTLNCDLIRQQGENREKVKTGISNYLLNRRPSPIYGPFTFKQVITFHALWYGAGRAYIHRDGRASELIILDPSNTTTGIVDGEVWNATYIQRDQDKPANRLPLFKRMEQNPENVIMIPDRDCFRVTGFGDGINGVPLYEAARLTLEASLGADERVKDQITKGFVGKILLNAPAESPQFRTAEQASEFLTDFTAKHGQDGEKLQVGLLRGGITATTISTQDNSSAEFAETRKMLNQNAALYLLLESMLGTENNASYNSLEQKQLSYLLNCLESWLCRWEDEADYKLLSRTQFESGEYFHKFNTASLLRTDMSTTASVYSTLIASRVINPNEARAKLDLNQYEGGNEFLNPNTTSTEAQLEGQTVDQQPDAPDNDREAAAVENRIQVLLTQEEKQVNKRLKRGETLAQIEDWYNNYSNNLGDVVETLGGDRIVAQQHCVESIRHIARRPGRFDLTGSAKLITERILDNV